MRKHVVPTSAALLALASLLPCSARADDYTFTLTGIGAPGLSGFGTLTTAVDPNHPGVQDVVALSGTINNGALTGDYNPATISLIPILPEQATAGYSTITYSVGIDPIDKKPSYFFLTYDNYLAPGSSSLVDGYGLGFTSSNGVSYELGALNGGYAYEAYTNSEFFDQQTLSGPAVDFSITPVSGVTPEPESMTLFSTGVLGLAALLRRRRTC